MWKKEKINKNVCHACKKKLVLSQVENSNRTVNFCLEHSWMFKHMMYNNGTIFITYRITERDGKKVRDIIDIVDADYNNILLSLHLIKTGQAPPQIMSQEESYIENLFLTGKLLINLTNRAHKSGFCACPSGDETYMKNMRDIFYNRFGDAIENEDWLSRNLGKVEDASKSKSQGLKQ